MHNARGGENCLGNPDHETLQNLIDETNANMGGYDLEGASSGKHHSKNLQALT